MERVSSGFYASAKDVKFATTRDHCPVVLELTD